MDIRNNLKMIACSVFKFWLNQIKFEIFVNKIQKLSNKIEFDYL
jgi:hypothetical protein